MPFLPPNQQRQSTEGKKRDQNKKNVKNVFYIYAGTDDRLVVGSELRQLTSGWMSWAWRSSEHCRPRRGTSCGRRTTRRYSAAVCAAGSPSGRARCDSEGSRDTPCRYSSPGPRSPSDRLPRQTDIHSTIYTLQKNAAVCTYNTCSCSC